MVQIPCTSSFSAISITRCPFPPLEIWRMDWIGIRMPFPLVVQITTSKESSLTINTSANASPLFRVRRDLLFPSFKRNSLNLVRLAYPHLVIIKRSKSSITSCSFSDGHRRTVMISPCPSKYRAISTPISFGFISGMLETPILEIVPSEEITRMESRLPAVNTV